MGLCFQENVTVACVLGKVTPEAGATRLGWSSSAVAVRAGLSMASDTVFAADLEAVMLRGVAGVLYVVPLVA